MRMLLLFLSLLLFIPLIAQEPPHWQLTDEDGLPSMTVYTIAQDSKGYMWIGTAAGLCRYDGKKFEYYRHPEQLDDEIIHLKIDKYDRVWYANLAGQLFFVKSGKPNIFKHQEIKTDWDLKLFEIKDSLLLLSYIDKKKKEKGTYGKSFLFNTIKDNNPKGFPIKLFETKKAWKDL